jgi:hypothetical protein
MSHTCLRRSSSAELSARRTRSAPQPPGNMAVVGAWHGGVRPVPPTPGSIRPARAAAGRTGCGWCPAWSWRRAGTAAAAHKEPGLHQRGQGQQHHPVGVVVWRWLGLTATVQDQLRLAAAVATPAVVMDTAQPASAVGGAGARHDPALPQGGHGPHLGMGEECRQRKAEPVALILVRQAQLARCGHHRATAPGDGARQRARAASPGPHARDGDEAGKVKAAGPLASPAGMAQLVVVKRADVTACDQADRTAKLRMLGWWRKGLHGGVPADRPQEGRVQQQGQPLQLAGLVCARWCARQRRQAGGRRAARCRSAHRPLPAPPSPEPDGGRSTSTRSTATRSRSCEGCR